jgi:hypothetical protein
MVCEVRLVRESRRRVGDMFGRRIYSVERFRVLVEDRKGWVRFWIGEVTMRWTSKP